jgi:hypothetical protein
VTKVSASNNKARGKADERKVAELIGTTRYPADVGGPVDLVPVAGYWPQVKGGLRVVSEFQKRALDGARAAATADPAGIGCLFLVDRSGPRVRTFVLFDANEWAAREGLGAALNEPE